MRRLLTMLAIALFAVSTVAATGCGDTAKKDDKKTEKKEEAKEGEKADTGSDKK